MLCTGFLNHIDDLDYSKFLKLTDSRTRRNQYKLFKKRVGTSLGQSTFSNRVCNAWNKLPDIVVQAGTVKDFKLGIDQ